MRNRTYLSRDFSKGYPVGDSIYYVCSICGFSVSSQPPKNAACMCGNIAVRPEPRKVLVKDVYRLRAYALNPNENSAADEAPKDASKDSPKDSSKGAAKDEEA